MSELVVDAVDVHKTFRRRGHSRPALSGMTLQVPAQGVHGFLGPNGSGKTTTLRVLLGLVRADSGSMTVLGKRVPEQLPSVIAQVGALIETPLFFPTYSGRRNLSLLAGVASLPASRVEEVLEQVGLRERAGDRVKTYSLGMRQRLGIGAALLKKPRLLILDEPSNGLDPAGIREVRQLLRRLGDSGVSVLLSSHLLSEVQQVCDSVSIVSGGRQITAGPVASVLAGASSGDVRVVLADLDAGARVLAAAGIGLERRPDALLARAVGDPARISELLAREGLYLRELTPVAADLESVFLQLTGTPDTPESRLPLQHESPTGAATAQPGAGR